MNRAARIFMNLVTAAFLCAALVRCANTMVPQGGPKDSIPPKVVNMTPAIGSRNFNDKKIFIEFDEYVQIKDQSKEFFTSPFMKKKPVVTTRGRGIQISIQDTLLENQTYALNFGSSIRDNNEGNILYGLRYVFSTGSAIDSMFMSGYAVDARTEDSLGKTFIYFYDAALDTIPEYDSLLFKMQPSAVARAENNGIFVAQNLKPIPYKMYAVYDQNGNQSYDPGVDKVGFLDTLCNPADLSGFAYWFDTMRKYPNAEPQTFFRLFTDKQFKRQNLTAQERPGKHQAVFRFGAPYPDIVSLVFDSIPSDSVIIEYQTRGKDTLSLWFACRPESIPDTIKGTMVYFKHDSINNLVLDTVKLRLGWKYFESKEETKRREAEEKERKRAEEAGEEYVPEPQPNPFRFKVDASAEINPEKNIPIEFAMPLVRMDSSRISLVRILEGEQTEPMPFAIRQDTANMRKWTISAPWKEDEKYRLLIPAGVFVNVASQSNDTLRAEFSIIKAEKYSTIVASVKGKTPESKYILQLIDATNNKILKTQKDIVTGRYEFRYMPEGAVRVRITEDLNGNGEWDSGDLIARRQPERVSMYVSEQGEQNIPTKANWEMDVDLDMNRIFAPETIQSVIDRIEQQDMMLARSIIERRAEKAKQEAERKRGGGDESSGGSMGFGSALSGVRSQVGTVIK